MWSGMMEWLKVFMPLTMLIGKEVKLITIWLNKAWFEYEIMTLTVYQ
jgi:hypothetical protein